MNTRPFPQGPAAADPGAAATPASPGQPDWLRLALAPATQALHGRAVLVLGLGASGLALARWCALAGAQVTVADTRASAPHAAVLAAEAPQTTVRLQTRLDAALFAAADWALVCRSPGILPSDMAGLATAAQQAGVAIVGELGLFGQALEALGGAAELPVLGGAQDLAGSLDGTAAATGAGLGRGSSVTGSDSSPCLLYTSPSPRDS